MARAHQVACAAFLLLAFAGSSLAEDGARPRIDLPRLATPPNIDGVLDDEAWQGPPLQLGEWLTYNPVNGQKLAQLTKVWAGYDERFLYFAFRCQDPEPAKVRGTLSRRDQLWNDDWVGLSLDSVGNGQSSYDMFVNPVGVQGDILTTVSAGENTAPDWVWESAGKPNGEGYDVEIRLPLKSVRFKSGAEVRMGIVFWRRVSRLGTSVSWPELLPGRTVFERHASLVLHDVKSPLVLELIPSVTYAWNQARTTPSAFGPADSDPDAGLSVKYGVTSSATIEGTVNPDFSQVESDAFQVEVNQRFPLFFSEKRPFFMEGMGTYELAGSGGDANMRTAVHTRRIVDPLWGAKFTGSAGRVTFAAISAGDQAPGRDQDGVRNPHRGRDKLFNITRGLYNFGPSRYVGGIVTDAEFADGYNRVAGADVSLRFGKHAWNATFLASGSRTPDGKETKDGLAGQTFYAFENKRVTLVTQAEHYDTDFQMDTAFLNRTGITGGWSFAALSFYPESKRLPAVKRVVPFVFSLYGQDRVQDGGQVFVLPGIRMHFTRQGFLRIDSGWGREPWAGRQYSVRNTRIMGGAQLTKWLNLFVNSGFSRTIFYDPVTPFSGDSRYHSLELTLQPSGSFNQYVSYNRVAFDRASNGERVFTVNVLNTRTTYQFDKHFFLRAIMQYDSSRKRVLTDFLASFELLPGTVAYAGYGSLIERQEWDGTAWKSGVGDYLTTRRGFFLKASYIHRF